MDGRHPCPVWNVVFTESRTGPFEHRVVHQFLADASEPAGAELPLDGGVHDQVQHFRFDLELHAVHLEELLVLPDDGVLGLGEDAAEGGAVQLVQVGDDRETADNLRNEAIGPKVLGINIL